VIRLFSGVHRRRTLNLFRANGLLFALAACGGGGDSGAGSAGSGNNPFDGGFDSPTGLADGGKWTTTDAARPLPSDAGRTGCGDGKLQSGEACDDGNDRGGDGCSADCKNVEQDFLCPAPNSACISTIACGDRRLSGPETCDDGNQVDGDGCSKSCAIEPGYLCSPVGARCAAIKCGDGIVAGGEACDDGNQAAADGCSTTCTVEAGFVCPQAGKACRATVCNDGVKEGSEACDDGNQVVGDGCTPFCEVEPDCSAGACHSRCGDGMMLPDDQEECDDGNTHDHDGCSSQCKIEAGYSCSLQQDALPDTLSVPVTYRDVIALPTVGATRHPDFEIFHGSVVTPGLLAPMLDGNGKPVYTGICDSSKTYPSTDPKTGPCPYNQQMTTQANFDQWYRDVPGVNITKVAHMVLAHDPTSNAYKIANASFFPWDGDSNGWVSLGKESLKNAHDFGFTSEVRTYFECKLDPAHPQVLTFSGDDDVWVYVNRRLAVDIGGLHSKLTGSMTLNAATASSLGMEDGKIYEMALFHAERHSSASNFNLTLDGFVSTHSHCAAKCGDGIVAGDEVCDDGVNDGSYGSCSATCQRGPYCGDGIVQAGHETCDDGVNLTTYSASGKPACAPGCKPSAYCGDGHLDSTAGEECDNGANSGGYGQCDSSCKRGSRCGDGVIDPDEVCDDGNLISGDGCSSSCQYDGPQ
jgi:fibro-slime domain-containing protein